MRSPINPAPDEPFRSVSLPEEDMKIKEREAIAQAVNSFCTAAMEKGDFASPAKLDHRLHGTMTKAVRQLRSLGEPGIKALKALLSHDSKYVRIWAASELLATGDEDARPVLELLVTEGGLLGMGAKIVLQEYEAGRLRSPFSPAKT